MENSVESYRMQAAPVATGGRSATLPKSDPTPTVDVVIPVLNEERDLGLNLPVLRDFLAGPEFSYRWRIVIADNGSEDDTPAIAQQLARRYPGEVDYLRVSAKGKGRAIKEAWERSSADIVSFMDIDLSTGLDAFTPLIDPIAHDEADIVIGSRLHPRSKVRRSLKRRIMTYAYNSLIQLLFRPDFHDAQCGFKAARRESAETLLPLVQDLQWFFDTEFLLMAQKLGYRISEVPVTWVEDKRSSVNVVGTVTADLRGLLRMRLSQPWRRAAAASTARAPSVSKR